MKKNMKYLLLVLCGFLGFAQEKGSVVLNWKNKEIYSNERSNYVIPQFNQEFFRFSFYDKTMTCVVTITNGINQRSDVEIINPVFETIPESYLGDLNKEKFPNSLKSDFNFITARDKQFGQLNVSPIIKENNSYKKLLSFEYRISQSTARTYVSNNVSAIESSVLATGDWYRFYVEKSGVYKISKGFLNSLGMNTNADPRKIKIFGNGGRMVPLLNSEEYPAGLEENAIKFVGESDGIFDDQDYILFYAEGVDNWSQENQTNLNLYANKSYYYVTVSGSEGKRIVDLTQPDDNPTVTINTFDNYKFHEVDKENIAKLGRVWFGEQFSIDNSQDFDFDFPNLVTSSPVNFRIHLAAASAVITSFKAEVNSQIIGTSNFSAISANSSTEAIDNYISNNIPITNNTFSVKITYDNGGAPNSKGYLDYINVKAKCELKGTSKQFRFQFDDAASLIGVGKFDISNASSINEVWDITDIFNVTKTENVGASNTFSFKTNLGEIRKYIAVVSSDYYFPLKESKARVSNLDLKGTVFKNNQGQFQDVDYLIFTPRNLNSQAEKLANFHRNNSQLNVKVINLDDVYTEFSSGKQDIGAIRNFIKYVYFNASSSDKRIKYVNLFGDASYDFKDRISGNTNIVPIYQSLNSYTEGESSFASDDFYGLMDANEGRIDF
ncbi:MAG TPA: type IX secretion system sortase PorU, partial [Flavobacterium sp.]|nr:type IX secretion system sortase PorU [Flavobacterium sp.]